MYILLAVFTFKNFAVPDYYTYRFDASNSGLH